MHIIMISKIRKASTLFVLWKCAIMVMSIFERRNEVLINEIRWKQRFINFERAFKKFTVITSIQNMGEIEKMALIQAFEFTFELSWKLLKDYLEYNGFDVNSPKEALRQAYQSKYINNGEVWMNALKKRNETSHLYNDQVLEDTAAFIVGEFTPVLNEMYIKFKTWNIND